MSGILAYLTASLLYGLIGWYFWRTKWKASTQSMDGAIVASGWESFTILIPLTLHGYTLYLSIFAGAGLSFGIGNAVSSIVWLTALVYWLSSFFYRLEVLQTLVAPIAAVAVLLPLLFPSLRPLANTEFPAFTAHILIAMMAYSLLTIAALHALLMAVVERRLHNPSMSSVQVNLPPLLDMEELLFRIIWVGFILLTLTLISGAVFSEEVFGQPIKLTHKTLFGFISWGVFAALLTGRKLYGWRGRIAIRWTLIGFVILLLAYLGSKFVLEVILQR
ncbi:MAG: cytochrome C biogenesis protein [Betaproteobacteria bacterium]|nr:MAG: cytochrome C biogenesis protein [Betaproteobacteria bacterium]